MGLLDTVSKVGSAASGLFNIGSTLIQNNAQKKAQAREFRNNKEMWNLANQYNTPEMQMSRLRDAGLNPHLVYGNGSVTGNTSTQTPKYQAPQLQRMPLENISPLEILSTFADLKQKSAQADLATSQAKYQDTKLAQEQELRWILGTKGYGELGLSTPDIQKSPYMRKISAEVRSAEQNNLLKDYDLQFLKTIPKEYQFLIPIIRSLFPTGNVINK